MKRARTEDEEFEKWVRYVRQRYGDQELDSLLNPESSRIFRDVTTGYAAFDRVALFNLARVRKFQPDQIVTLNALWHELTLRTMSKPFLFSDKDWRRDAQPYRFVEEWSRLARKSPDPLFWRDAYHWCERTLALQMAYACEWARSCVPVRFLGYPMVDVRCAITDTWPQIDAWTGFSRSASLAKGGGSGLREEYSYQNNNTVFMSFTSRCWVEEEFEDMQSAFQKFLNTPDFTKYRPKVVFERVIDQMRWKLTGKIVSKYRYLKAMPDAAAKAVPRKENHPFAAIVFRHKERDVMALNLAAGLQAAQGGNVAVFQCVQTLFALDPFALVQVLEDANIPTPDQLLDQVREMLRRGQDVDPFERPKPSACDEKLLEFAQACEAGAAEDRIEALADELYPLLESNRDLIKLPQRGYLAYQSPGNVNY